jgi:methionyl-tRNA formyltransferase
MNYVYFGNSRAGYEMCRWLCERGDAPAALVVHPKDSASHRQELIDVSGLPPERIFSADTLAHESTHVALRELAPVLGVSAFFGYILDASTLSLFSRGCINIHPSWLPYNRGAFPNVWTILDHTPCGVTIHLLDEGVDTGPILCQREVPVAPTDTGETLYHRLEEACIELFRDSWPAIARGAISATPQAGHGSLHRRRDVESIDQIDLDRLYRAGDLIDLLRARTFRGYPGAYFVHEGRRVYLRLSLDLSD